MENFISIFQAWPFIKCFTFHKSRWLLFHWLNKKKWHHGFIQAWKVTWLLLHVEKAWPALTPVKCKCSCHGVCVWLCMLLAHRLRERCLQDCKQWKCSICMKKWHEARRQIHRNPCLNEALVLQNKLLVRWEASSHGVRIFPRCHHSKQRTSTAVWKHQKKVCKTQKAQTFKSVKNHLPLYFLHT